jgi:hypothetical protein
MCSFATTAFPICSLHSQIQTSLSKSSVWKFRPAGRLVPLLAECPACPGSADLVKTAAWQDLVAQVA